MVHAGRKISVKSRPTRGLCRGGDCTTKSRKIPSNQTSVHTSQLISSPTIKFKFPDRREIDRHLYHEFRRTRASVKLQTLVRKIFRQTDERRKITSIQLPFPLLFPLNAMVPEDRGSEKTPKNSVNSTTVPALVPAQYDGSGGPWQ